MPRLNHKKARTGCVRCKARKVKCDELRPRCSACARHNVSCVYVEPAPRKSDYHHPTTPPREGSAAATHGDETDGLDSRLEIRLMHEWTANTCSSFSDALHLWRNHVPLFAMQHRIILDAMFGLAALRLYRQDHHQQSSISDRFATVKAPPCDSNIDEAPPTTWRDAGDLGGASLDTKPSTPATFIETKPHEMLVNARRYYERAVDGQQSGLVTITRENVEALYITSVLIAFHALFTLNEPEDDITSPFADPILWLRVASGTRCIRDVWREFAENERLEGTSAFVEEFRIVDEEGSLRWGHCTPFETLLTFARDFESSSREDEDAYEKFVSYIALVHNSISRGIEDPLVNCSRLATMPFRLPKRVVELIETRAPRAMVILAHCFALMKLISDKVSWFEGIAELQIPKILQIIPPGWREQMNWPVRVSEGRFEQGREEAVIRDFLAL